MFREFDYDKLPVVDIVNDIITDAAGKNASDIHFDPTPTILKVRIRVDGELIDYANVPETVKNPLITRIKIIAGMNITESRLPQDGAIKNLVDDNTLDLRVSTLPIVYGEKVVIRILNYSMSSSGLENLGFIPKNLEKVQNLIKEPNGIILVTGATGTGKSTTVYSMLQVLNTSERNIITVEDPVEMKLAGINQVQTMNEIGLNFANALRSILRQDPDIIMIGEIRDDETARIAVRASITGHLVLSTIHTNTSLNTIERLLDMDIERYLLGSALIGIVSQRLVKRLCPKCRKSRPVTPYEKNVLKHILKMDITDIYTPVGCEDCYKGYRGRVALHEILVINQDIRDAITGGVQKAELRKLVYGTGETITILEDGLIKVIDGLTSFEEILRVIDIADDVGNEETEVKNALIGKVVKKEDKDDNESKNVKEEKIEEVKEDNDDAEELQPIIPDNPNEDLEELEEEIQEEKEDNQPEVLEEQLKKLDIFEDKEIVSTDKTNDLEVLEDKDVLDDLELLVPEDDLVLEPEIDIL